MKTLVVGSYENSGGEGFGGASGGEGAEGGLGGGVLGLAEGGGVRGALENFAVEIDGGFESGGVIGSFSHARV